MKILSIMNWIILGATFILSVIFCIKLIIVLRTTETPSIESIWYLLLMCFSLSACRWTMRSIEKN